MVRSIFKKYTSFAAFAFILAVPFLLDGCSDYDPNTLEIDFMNREVVVFGTIYPHRYNVLPQRENGHHFIVWTGGTNARKALINTDVPDENILAGLMALGALPGDNLTADAWNERDNPDSPEPDKRVEGAAIEILVEWDTTVLPIYDLFQDGVKDDFDIRFGGHEELISLWMSGCVTCLFSCPGGRTSNAVYTIRDQVKDRKTFVANEGVLPQDGTKVTIRFRPLFEDE